MAINKVIDRNNNVLIDLTNDTIAPNKVLEGVKFHGNDGSECVGTLAPNKLDCLKYNFIDYDGTLLYSFTDEELDALTELPAGPNHTDDNLTFQEWNWSLEDLKAWNRSRITRPIVGANLITSDGKSYIYIDTTISNGSINVYCSANSIDWGDGNIDTASSHTYANPGTYIIVIDHKENSSLSVSGYSAPGATSLVPWITNIKIGNVSSFSSYSFNRAFNLRKINIPCGTGGFSSYCFPFCTSLLSLVIPRNIGAVGGNCFEKCYSLKYISIPNGFTSFAANMLVDSSQLEAITIPDSVTTIENYALRNSRITAIDIPSSVKTIGQYALSGTSLRSINIEEGVTSFSNYALSSNTILDYMLLPDSITTIGTSALDNTPSFCLDLTKQSKVISLTNSIGSFTPQSGVKIMVPQGLLEQYKSASYWSNYASCMVGV